MVNTGMIRRSVPLKTLIIIIASLPLNQRSKVRLRRVLLPVRVGHETVPLAWLLAFRALDDFCASNSGSLVNGSRICTLRD